MLEHLELSGLRLVELLLELVDVRRGALKLLLELSLAVLHAIVVFLPEDQLAFNVLLLGQTGI